MMILDRRGDHDCVNVGIVEKALIIGYAFQIGVKAPDVFEAILAYIAYRFQLTARQAPEVPNQERTPVTTADDAY